MTAAFTFPGQGSQAVGMGKALADAFPAARAVFDEVDSALGEKLTGIIWDGPAETLQLTENAQPALMAVSLATHAGAGGRGRLLAWRGCGFRRRPLARRIFGAGRGRQPQRHAIRRACCGPAVLRCRRPCRSASAPWRRCSASITRPPWPWPEKPRRARCARPPTTMAAVRWWSPATRPRSNARWRSPRPRAPSARCCCRCRRRSIAALMQPAADAMAEALAKVTIKTPAVAAGVQRAGGADHRSRRDPPPPGRAGHRHRALARVAWPTWQAQGVTRFFEIGCRQGAERARQAHCRRRRRRRRRRTQRHCRRQGCARSSAFGVSGQRRRHRCSI